MKTKLTFVFAFVFTFFYGYFSIYADSLILPFAVTVDGQEAVAESEQAVFATINTPVSNKAELAVDDDSGMIILNIFSSDDSGNVKPGIQPVIIILQGDNKTTLDNTMDKKKLDPGCYLMNIMSSGKTARIFFEVK